MAILISTQNLAKSFAGKTLFKNLSFGINEGDKAALVGPNGAGKSTLMKILMGIVEPDNGQVIKKKSLKIGYLDQKPEFKATDTLFSVLADQLEHPDEELGAIYEWLGKMDLLQFDENSLATSLSGGWQKRLALARELIKGPELLMLDEPTNHLDISSILWLEEFLVSQNVTVFMITHDRLFLQRTCTKVYDLDPHLKQGLLVSEGDYVQYLENKEQLRAQQQSTQEKMTNTFKRETEWLRRGAKARQTKQKARIERAGDLKEDLQDLSAMNRQKIVGIDFGESGRQPKKLIELKNVFKSFGSQNILKDFSYIISPNTRLGLIGDNGVGKSTLVKLITGVETPDSGTITQGDAVTVSYFEQNKQTLDPSKSLLRNIASEGDYVDFQGKFIYAKSYLQRFLFHTEQMDLPVAQLSGGEQSRLRIAQMMLTTSSVLILDEPTNDLDIETLAVLEESLKDYNGAVILITHDRYFMDQVATEIMAMNKDENDQRHIQKFADYLQWESWFENNKDKKPEKPAPVATKIEVVETPTKMEKKKKVSFKDKTDWENIEKEIAELEQRLESLKHQISDSQNASNPKKLLELTNELASAEALLEAKFERWAELDALMKG
jgi:ATP-binding cassette subfamily F protein uup